MRFGGGAASAGRARAVKQYGRIATTTRRSYTDRNVKPGTTWRYRVVLVSSGGVRSVPSKTIVVKVR
jgi:fibronectin type 3 domain-containing protein